MADAQQEQPLTTGMGWLLLAETARQPPCLLHPELYEQHVPSGKGMRPSGLGSASVSAFISVL